MEEASLLGAAALQRQGSRVMTVGFGGQPSQVGDLVLAFPGPGVDL